jgi:hypothetical protein
MEERGMIDWLDRWRKMQRERRPGDARCENCVYWEFSHYWEELKFLDDDDNAWGDCHRHAPSPFQSILTKLGNTLGSVAWATEAAAHIKHSENEVCGTDYHFEGNDQHEVWQWPLTKSDDWCGDFKAGRVPMNDEDRAYFTKQDDEDAAAERAAKENEK